MMIIERGEGGRIVGVTSEPHEKSVLDVLMAQPNRIHFPPVEADPTIVYSASGKVQFDEFGEPLMASQNIRDLDIIMHMQMLDENDNIVPRNAVALRDDIPVEHDPFSNTFKVKMKADGKDNVELANLHDPLTVIVDGEPYVVTGGTLDFTTSEPGVYLVEFDFPQQACKVEITAE